MGKIVGRIIAWCMVVASAILIISCGAKKTEIKKELKASEVVREEVKTIKENKETKKTYLKKKDVILISEDLDLTADEIIIQEGSKTTTIKKPFLKQAKSKNNKTVVEEASIDTMQEREAVIKSFERINEVIKSAEKQKERKQFDWGLLILQMLPVVILMCFLYKIWIKIKGQ